MKRNIVAALAVMGCVYGTCEASEASQQTVYFSESDQTWKDSRGNESGKLPTVAVMYSSPVVKQEIDTLTAFCVEEGKAEGHSKGYSEGSSAGYSDGYSTGYAAGAEGVSSLQSANASLTSELEAAKKTLEEKEKQYASENASLKAALEEAKKNQEETEKKQAEEIATLKAELEKLQAALESEKRESSCQLAMFLSMLTNNLELASSIIAGAKSDSQCQNLESLKAAVSHFSSALHS